MPATDGEGLQPMSNGNKSSSEQLSWLVDRRAKIQADLLAILRFIENNRTYLDANLPALSATLIIIGAAFSLWRDVFLGDASLSTDAVARSAEKFLQTLIADNAIGYPQDRQMRDWSFGYYVNNAALRVGELTHRSVMFADMLREHSLTNMGWQILGARPANEVWDTSFSALHLAVENAETIIKCLPTAVASKLGNIEQTSN